MSIALRYTLFALIATVANIGSQAAAVPILIPITGNKWAVILSVLLGTGVGIIVKYLLDKKWVFAFQAKSLAHQAQTFSLYTLFSGATTLVFWGFEFGAQWIFGTDFARYTGGVIGLAIGYVTKYHLDKRITFAQRSTVDTEGTV